MRQLLLASSSAYRRELLSRLRLPFECVAPDIDERALPDEHPTDLVTRLARLKAGALAGRYTDHLVIGSDQVAVLGNHILGKPHTLDRAAEQLKASSGKTVEFLTGLALLDSRDGSEQYGCVSFKVHFRNLSDEQIERYLQAEQPLDCAGSFKAEGLGISLFRSTEGPDATSLVGLPLISLVSMLHKAGLDIP